MRLPARTPALLLLLPLGILLGGRCGLNTIRIDEPAPQQLVDDPEPAVAMRARLGRDFDPATASVRIDGTDLLDALGVVPPFQDVSGTVATASGPVAVSGFLFRDELRPQRVELVAEGLAPGAHRFEVEATREGAPGPLVRAVAFTLVEPLVAAEDALASSARVGGPAALGGGDALVVERLGGPLAAPPTALSEGGTLRPGFVEAAAARIRSGGTP